MSKLSSEKIIRMTNRALKRTTIYQESQDDETARPELFAILKKDDNAKGILALATFDETEFFSFHPGLMDEPRWHWGGLISIDILEYLNNGCELVFMPLSSHAAMWHEMSECESECAPSGEALQKYLEYCRRNNVTFEKVRDVEAYIREEDLPGCLSELRGHPNETEWNTGGSSIMREMTKDGFWQLIAEAKKECGQDMDATIQWMTDRLTILGPQQAQDFHDILHGYQDLAYQYGLWTAASIMCEYGCSDDGFIDFRSWLISQGREVYLAALRSPDSLADIDAYGGCKFESFAYVGYKVLEKLTGQNAYESTSLADERVLISELEKDIVYGEGIGYPYAPNETAAYLPRLCGKCLTPAELSILAESKDGWNLSNEQIRAARAAGPKNAPVYRPLSQPAPKPEAPAPHDIEQIITDMRAETIRRIQQDRDLPEGQLARYWSYIGSLDMAQHLGLISDERRQALCHEAEQFKPDCAVTENPPQQDIKTTAEIMIGGMK